MGAKNLIQSTCILMYHGVSHLGGQGTLRVNDFERQIKYLYGHYRFISLNDLMTSRQSTKKNILLTFDDGFHNNYKYVVPILRRLKIPAIFFVNNRHCTENKFLWFSYIRAMKCYFKETGVWLRGSYFDLSEKKREESFCTLRTFLLKLEPHPSELYKIIDNELPQLANYIPNAIISEYFSGMSKDEVKLIADDSLFDIGIHTVDHVFLPKCSQEEIKNQITENIDFIRCITRKQPNAIAYPGGKYNEKVMEICRGLDIRFGFAIQPAFSGDDCLQLPRIGIYSPSLCKLFIKVALSNQIRSFKIPIG